MFEPRRRRLVPIAVALAVGAAGPASAQLAVETLADINEALVAPADGAFVQTTRCGELPTITTRTAHGRVVWQVEASSWRPLVVLPTGLGAIEPPAFECVADEQFVWFYFESFLGRAEVWRVTRASKAAVRLAHLPASPPLAGARRMTLTAGGVFLTGGSDFGGHADALLWREVGGEIGEGFVAPPWARARRIRLFGHGFAVSLPDDSNELVVWRLSTGGGASAVARLPFADDARSRFVVGPGALAIGSGDRWHAICLSASEEVTLFEIAAPMAVAASRTALYTVTQSGSAREVRRFGCSGEAEGQWPAEESRMFGDGNSVLVVNCAGDGCDWLLDGVNAGFSIVPGPRVIDATFTGHPGAEIGAIRDDRAVIIAGVSSKGWTLRVQPDASLADRVVGFEGLLSLVTSRSGAIPAVRVLNLGSGALTPSRSVVLARSAGSDPLFLDALDEPTMAVRRTHQPLVGAEGADLVRFDGAVREIDTGISKLRRSGETWSYGHRTEPGALQIQALTADGKRTVFDALRSDRARATSGIVETSPTGDLALVEEGANQVLLERSRSGETEQWRVVSEFASTAKVALVSGPSFEPVAVVETASATLELLRGDGTTALLGRAYAGFVVGVSDETFFITARTEDGGCALWAVEPQAGRRTVLESSGPGCGVAALPTHVAGGSLYYPWRSQDGTSLRVARPDGSTSTVVDLLDVVDFEWAAGRPSGAAVPFLVRRREGPNEVWSLDLEGMEATRLAVGEHIVGLSLVEHFALYWSYRLDSEIAWRVEGLDLSDAGSEPFTVARPVPNQQGVVPVRLRESGVRRSAPDASPMFVPWNEKIVFGSFAEDVGVEPSGFPMSRLECRGCCSDAECEGGTCEAGRCEPVGAPLALSGSSCGCSTTHPARRDRRLALEALLVVFVVTVARRRR